MRLRLKRYYPLLIALVLVTGGLLLGLGNQRIIAYTVKGSGQAEPAAATFTGNIALFDHNLVHSVKIQMDDADYQAMLTTYQQTGVKDYFHAAVVIDGVQINDVGIRLKGNASLRTAVGGRGGGMGQNGNPQGQPNGNLPPQPNAGQGPGRPNPQNVPNENPGPQLQGGMPGRGGGFGGSNTQIPLLIKFDKYVKGQNYQGYDRLAVRSAGVSYDASMLQEPVTNSVLRLAGLPATATTYAGVRLNGKAEQLYTLSEVIDQDYLKNIFPTQTVCCIRPN